MSIVVEGLTKRYGSLLVVDQVSLEVQDRELFVLLGASGSGKSTILRIIAGLAVPDSGRVQLHGRDVTAVPAQKRGTGFVFQNYSIFRHMTVAENIEFGLRIRKVPRAERRRRSEELLDLVGLGGLGARYANQLSGGQQQRVALARALAYEPSVLLLDEPFGALDVKIRAQLRRSLKEIQRQLRVTMILVTHDQEEAFELADRIGVIERGKLLEVGGPEELYRAPQSELVATFLGAGNLLIGRAAGGFALLGDVALPLPAEAQHEDGARVRVLFRPENTVLTAEKPGPELTVVGRGRILEQTFAGSVRRVRLRLPRLTGTRQVAPALPFGEDGMLIDAMLPGEVSVSTDELWLALRGYHVLRQQPWKLQLREVSGGEAGWLGLVRWLTEKLHANLVRGSEAPTLYDLMLVPAGPEGEEVPERVLEALAERDAPPILVVRGERQRIEHMMVCTAVGEPGKQDVQFGGRLARRLGAAVTLFHCVRPGQEPAPRVLVHMERSLATLRSLDIRGHLAFGEAANPVDGILAEAKRADCDLILIGAPRAGTVIAGGRAPVTLQLLERSDRPVLVVPSLV